jgi:hypothetical protein
MSKFKWDAWDFDCDGEAYVIAKRECPNKQDVPDYIVREDNLLDKCKIGMKVEECWCKWQVRSDWYNSEGKPKGGYCVETYEPHIKDIYGKRKRGWFEVWVVRKSEWY